MKCSKLGDGKDIKKMKKLVYENLESIVINDNPGEIYNFTVDSLGQYFCDEFDEMFSAEAMEVAQSFVDHYNGFRIEEC